MDLGSYFARIGYQESRAVSLETLNAIVSAHVRTIPFENLAVLLGEPISLAIADVTEKLVYRRYGGYCFEHNTLLLHVLEELGFSVTALSARSRYQWPERYSLPRTHMCLRVDLGRRTFLVDGGFGGLSPTAALEIVADVEQQTPHEPRRFVREGHWEALALRGPDAVIIHQAHLGDAWHDLYELTLEPMPPVDREMGNWYTSCHPNSHFRNKLMVARATEHGRLTLGNRELTRRCRNSSTETRILRTHDELSLVLWQEFGIRLAQGARLACAGLAGLE
jgi:N-hydroxyarylamine O-acetyltransferase